MKDIKCYIKEALKINSKSKVVKSFGEIELSEPGSNERASLVLNIMKEKYGDKFDKIYINNHNDICICPLSKYGYIKYFVVLLNGKEGFSARYYFSVIEDQKKIDNIENFSDFLTELDKFIKENGF